MHPTNNKTVKQKIIWHLKVLAGAVILALLFAFILNQKIVLSQIVQMVIVTFVQLEIFIWLGNLFFNSLKEGTAGFKKKMILRLLMFYGIVLLIAFVFYLILYTYYFVENGSELSDFLANLFNNEMRGFFISALIGFTFGALFFFYVQWAEALKREQKLTQEKLIFQYETLKSQVNPHFLFNSLNSLSSLVRSDPDASEQFILKLSSLYRNILDYSEKELVPLAKEIELVKDFFYLQKVRDGNKVELNIEFDKFDKILVLPVSLQLLVENALKHNSATHNQPLEIAIHFEGIDKLVVRNNLQKKMQMNDSSKIGLKNLNERSRLILNQEIEINESANEFVVKIPVQIKK
jgi:hypothetical protein